ncbi:MAG: radical SAM protein [Selenomonadaceae bacterium]|nr:radical SAM protein [Selenomonadaceae bacterium]
MNWTQENELKARLQKEIGYVIHKAGARTKFALIYPNVYRVGMSNLGIHIIYDLLNSRKDTSCERFFLPEPKILAQLEKSKLPILSMETQMPLLKFPLIGFAVSFEPDYFNLLKILELGKIKLISNERGERDPIVIAGGPCATFNPIPLSLFIDAFVIGEGEVILPKLLDVFYLAKSKGLSRIETLKLISNVEGVYVPSESKNFPIKRQWLKNLDEYPAHTVIVTDDTEFNMYLIETARGCGRHCRFCMAGYCFRRPRNRSLNLLFDEVATAKKYHKKIGLMGAAISDYPQINELCQKISDEGLTMSVASFRADSVTGELVKTLAASGLKTLTIAPEAGSNKMRAVINKGIDENHIFNTIKLGLAAGIKNFRLYFMIGLPFETTDDVKAIVELSNRVKDFMESNSNRGKLTLSINPFIPKPFTPFQWSPMADKKYIDNAIKTIRNGLKRSNVEIIAESARESFVQSILSRGDRRISDVLMESHRRGGIKTFRNVLNDLNVDVDFYLYRQRDKAESFSWDILDMGFTKDYLYSEYLKAQSLQKTESCFDKCKRCGVCK